MGTIKRKHADLIHKIYYSLAATCFVGIGLYVIYALSIKLMLIEGIINICNMWGINSTIVAWNIARVLFFEVGALPGAALIVGGVIMLMHAFDKV